MNSKNKKIIIFTIIMIMSIFLSGCVEQSHVIDLEEDGSVAFEISITLNKDILETVNRLGYNLEPKKQPNYSNAVLSIDPMFRHYAEKYENNGMIVSPIDSAIEVGFLAKNTFSNINDFNSYLNSINKQGLTGLSGKLKKKNIVIKDLYSFEGQVKYEIDPELDLKLDDINMDELPFDTSNINANVSIYLPGSYTNMYGYDDRYTDPTKGFFITEDFAEGKPIDIGVFSEVEKKQAISILLTLGVVVGFIVIGKILNSLSSRKR